ncbi:MAG: hypothetical protein ABSA69_07670 [Verrucomicrobiota bacterium]|jgi:hypothetical protein
MNIESGGQLPDEFVMITDDVEAKAILLRCGILDYLTNPRTLAKTHTGFCCHFDHPTHWILGTYHKDNPKPEDNGFVVFGWPKKSFSKTIIKDFIESQNLRPSQDVIHFRKGDNPYEKS